MNRKAEFGSAKTVWISMLVVVIVLGFGALYWKYSEKVTADTKAREAAMQAEKEAAKPKSELLILSDLGVTLTVPSGLKADDIYYYKTHFGNDPEFYGFTTTRVRDSDTKCNDSVTGNLAKLQRSTAKTGLSGELLNQEPLKGYFYFLSSSVGEVTPTPPCLETDDAKKDHALLDKMLKSIRASES